MSHFASTPKPPYYAVIFTSILNSPADGYEDMAEKMVDLAAKQPGFLGVESARNSGTGNDAVGITVSYWSDLTSIQQWKENIEHREAQLKGQKLWYKKYRIRISKVERDY